MLQPCHSAPLRLPHTPQSGGGPQSQSGVITFSCAASRHSRQRPSILSHSPVGEKGGRERTRTWIRDPLKAKTRYAGTVQCSVCARQPIRSTTHRVKHGNELLACPETERHFEIVCAQYQQARPRFPIFVQLTKQRIPSAIVHARANNSRIVVNDIVYSRHDTYCPFDHRFVHILCFVYTKLCRCAAVQ